MSVGGYGIDLTREEQRIGEPSADYVRKYVQWQEEHKASGDVRVVGNVSVQAGPDAITLWQGPQHIVIMRDDIDGVIAALQSLQAGMPAKSTVQQAREYKRARQLLDDKRKQRY